MAHVAAPRQPLRSNKPIFQPQAAHRASSVRPAPRDTVKQPLYRRLLFPKEPPDKPVRQIIDGHGAEVDRLNERLYTFLAYALRAYVQSWFTRISPHDKCFIPHVASIIVTFLKPIIANVNPSRLLPLPLLHIPTILARHIQLYRIAAAHQGTSLAPLESSQRDLGHVYHSLAPLLACSPTPASHAVPSEKSSPAQGSLASSASSTSPPMQTKYTPSYQISPIYLQQLVTSLMKLHLPADDFAPDAERIVVREIVANVVLGNVLQRVSHAWFWWKVGLAVLGEPEVAEVPTFPIEGLGVRLWRVLVVPVAWQAMNSWIAARSASSFSENPENKINKQFSHVAQPSLDLLKEILPPAPPYTARTTFALAEAVESLLHCRIDSALPDLVARKVLTPSMGLKVIEKLTTIVFPLEGGFPGVTPPDPTPAEAAEMREKLELRIHQLVPPALRFVLLSTNLEEQHRKISEMLDPFSDTACNTHLIAMLLESLILTLVPELEIGL